MNKIKMNVDQYNETTNVVVLTFTGDDPLLQSDYTISVSLNEIPTLGVGTVLRELAKCGLFVLNRQITPPPPVDPLIMNLVKNSVNSQFEYTVAELQN